MLISASKIVVLALGVLILAMSLWGLIVPGKLMKLVDSVMENDWGIYFAVVIRLIFGAALLVAASGSRFPHLFEILGWIAIFAAIVIAIMGRQRLRRFVALLQNLSQVMIRTWLILGAAFGALLAYGVL